MPPDAKSFQKHIASEAIRPPKQFAPKTSFPCQGVVVTEERRDLECRGLRTLHSKPVSGLG